MLLPVYIYIQWGSLYIYIYTCNFHLWKQTNKPFWHSMSHPGSLISESNISWLMKLSPHNLVVSHPPKPTQATREPFFHSGPGPNFWLRWRYEPLEDLPFRQHVVSKMKGSVFFFSGIRLRARVGRIHGTDIFTVPTFSWCFWSFAQMAFFFGAFAVSFREGKASCKRGPLRIGSLGNPITPVHVKLSLGGGVNEDCCLNTAISTAEEAVFVWKKTSRFCAPKKKLWRASKMQKGHEKVSSDIQLICNGIYHTYNIHQAGYSMRDLFIPDRWKSPSQPLKVTKNCQEYRFYHYCPVWTLSWLLDLVHQHTKSLTLPETNIAPKNDGFQ